MTANIEGPIPRTVRLEQRPTGVSIRLLPLGLFQARIGCPLAFSIAFLSFFYWLCATFGFPHKIHSLGIDFGAATGEFIFWMIVVIAAVGQLGVIVDARCRHFVIELGIETLRIESSGFLDHRSWEWNKAAVGSVVVTELVQVGIGKRQPEWHALHVVPKVGPSVVVVTDRVRPRSELEWVAGALRQRLGMTG